MTVMSDNSTLVIAEDSPYRAFVAACGTSSVSSAKVHALKAQGTDSQGAHLVPLCGLGSAPPEAAPWPATVDCARCVALVTARLAGQQAVEAVERDNPHALRARIAELEQQAAGESERLAAVVASATESLRQAAGSVAAARRAASLWRSVAAAILIGGPSTSRRSIAFTELEAASIRAGVPWAELHDNEDGSAQVTAFLASRVPAVSSGHGDSGGQPGAAGAGNC